MRESSARNQEQTIHHQDIVQDYLDALLQEASLSVKLEKAVSVPVAAAVEIPAAAPGANTPLTRAAKASAATSTVSVDVNARQRVESLSGNALPVLATTLDQPRSTATERDIPDWGRQGFAVLLFDVAGIKMAAPLHALGGICLIENNLQSVVVQADWFMGLLRWNDRNLRVIDTARFVMPERTKDNSHRAHYQSVIVLGDSHWALAVDQANESTQLSSQDVRWKHLLGTRPWLAGTLLNRLCALVDVDSLTGLLEEADHSSPCFKEKH